MSADTSVAYFAVCVCGIGRLFAYLSLATLPVGCLCWQLYRFRHPVPVFLLWQEQDPGTQS